MPASIPARKFLSFLYTQLLLAISRIESPRFLVRIPLKVTGGSDVMATGVPV